MELLITGGNRGGRADSGGLPAVLSPPGGGAGLVGLAGRVAMEPVYSATKYGLRGFSLALRREVAGSGVSMSLVSPGKIDAAVTAKVQARLPGPDRVGRTIAGLVARPRREVIVPAKHYSIAFLEQVAPSAADVAHRKRNWGRIEEVITP